MCKIFIFKKIFLCYNIIKKNSRKEIFMGRKMLTKGLKSTLGGKKGSAKKKLISELSGVGLNDPKLNKGTSRQRRIKDTLDW